MAATAPRTSRISSNSTSREGARERPSYREALSYEDDGRWSARATGLAGCRARAKTIPRVCAHLRGALPRYAVSRTAAFAIVLAMLAVDHFDVRTVTLGISLRECADSDLAAMERRIYRKIHSVARNLVKKPKTKETILRVQQELFTVNAELATECEDYEKLTSKFKVVTADMVDQLEKAITEIEGEIEMPRAFVIPGANPASAALDVARAIVRRAERRLVTLRDNGEIRNEAILQYVNRLADLLFALARYEEA